MAFLCIYIVLAGFIIMGKSHLHAAKAKQADEFYTQLCDIEAELKHYNFSGKIVYCPCDDAGWSNFWRYFVVNFGRLGLRRVISTCFMGRDKVEFDGVEVVRTPLRTAELGVVRGDFWSAECQGLLHECDVVVTNPPFSKGVEFIETVIGSGKGLIILMHQTALGGDRVFNMFKDGVVWLGSESGKNMWFEVPEGYDRPTKSGIKHEGGKKFFSMCGIVWYVSYGEPRYPEPLRLTCRFSKGKYPQYSNEDGVDVSRTQDIPFDYDGLMGVPVSFLLRWNPAQFELLRLINPMIGLKQLFTRVLVRRKR